MTVAVRFFLAYLFISFNLLIHPAFSQGKIEIFTDVQDNDTLQNLVNILTGQLKKAMVKDITIQPASFYTGKGVYIKSTAIGKQPVKPSLRLLASGVEAFSINANEKGVQILANSNMGLGHGIFSWLEHLGYRFYFANPDWHIVPANPVLFREWSIISKPALYHRKIFYGYGTGSAKADKDFVFWQTANKMGGSLNAIFGHAYDDIMLRNKEEFKEHPEWFYPPAAKGTLPGEPKFDMSNEGLVQVVIKDVIRQIETSLKNKTQDYKMITLGPSDGLGTCNSPACQKLGSYTDRVFYLVNRVARAIQKKYPLTKIGCLAYSEYIAPPSGKIAPNVYVVITTAFNNSTYTIEELIDKWKKTGATIGVYDYFSWFAWDQDVPGQSIASRMPDLEKNIKKYYRTGIAGYDGESSMGWVSKGLGYYLVSKLMWDPGIETASLKKEFFELCFKKASTIMKQVWAEWEHYDYTQPRESDLARWIDNILEAEKTEQDSDVQLRLYQVKAYLHYLYLLRNYQNSKTEKDMLSLLSYGYRMLDDGSVAGYPAFFELGNRSGIAGMSYAKDAKWTTNPTKVSDQEMNSFIRSDRSVLKIAKPVKQYQTGIKLKPVPNINSYSSLVADSALIANNSFWMTNEWVIQIKAKSASNFLEMSGDFVKNVNNKKPIVIKIFPYSSNGELSELKPVGQFSYTTSSEKIKFKLDKLPAGLYSLLIEDPIKMYWIRFSDKINYSAVMRPGRQLQTGSLNYAFIYVPEGVKRFNVIKSRTAKFVTPTGRQVQMNTDKVEDIQVEVGPGETGLWRIQFLADRLFIEGIPPYIGLSPRQMLVPE